ncbi:MAG: N-acetylgalactosamine 6-sulfate sulfatase [Bacteroidetes bacterium]|nr:MAG: N-acetylgalactosamine 6-sulfate sulfatase [Bacteroidota bacterium]
MRLCLPLLCILLLGLACRPAPASRPPNVVLILTDDQGWGDLSLHGNPNLSTPHIDRLAERGAQFEHFYVSAVCSPTRAEVLTGRYAVRGGVYSTSAGGERLDLDETTVALHFQRAGYRTAAFGKWHNGMQYPYHPNARGFEEFYGFCSGHWGNYIDPMLEHNGELVQGEGFLPDDLTTHAIDFIRQHQSEPFFVYLPLNTPHSPMQMPDSVWAPFAGKTLTATHRDPEREDPDFTRAALALVENIDQNVGRLTTALDALGLTENTIVLFLSDNGPNSWRWNGGMKGRKGSVDEGGVRAPLLVQWPGTIPAGLRIPQLASALDLLPTLTDLAGIERSKSKPLDGHSLAPILRGDSTDWPDRLLINHWRGQTSVRSQRFRLDPEGKLFDMEADPGQSQDVSAAFPDPHQQLRAAQAAFEQGPLTELPPEDTRPFLVGHPDYDLFQLPTRDLVAHGGIQRSNRWPNCSYYTHWTSTDDSITLDLEVQAAGSFEVVAYYACPAADTGATVTLNFGEQALRFRVSQPHEAQAYGDAYDRVPRGESLVKDWGRMRLGTLALPAGRGQLKLQASSIPGRQVMELRLLMLRREKEK